MMVLIITLNSGIEFFLKTFLRCRASFEKKVFLKRILISLVFLSIVRVFCAEVSGGLTGKAT